jgi:hypothetical protein
LKAKILKQIGYELMTNKRGALVWVKPVAQIPAEAASEISAAQVLQLELAGLKEQQAENAKLAEKLKTPEVESPV